MAFNGQNLAEKYAPALDERFTRESQAMIALNNDYDFTGAKTVKVYSVPVAPLNDFDPNVTSGSAYGTAFDMTRNIQEMTVTQDKSFHIRIEKGEYLQSNMVLEAGRVLSRETDEVLVPYYDTFIFNKLASEAQEKGGHATTAITTANAYSCFLDALEWMGDRNVPEQGRVAFCSYSYANLLMQDPAFMKTGDKSQEMILKGIVGELDGVQIVKVPASRLPYGTAFLMTHKIAATAPKQLDEYKIHDNPPGWSGWIIEGRMIFDCFVLNNKADAIYVHDGQAKLKNIQVNTAATASGKSTIIVPGYKEGASYAYATAATKAALPTVTAGAAFSSGTAMSSDAEEITPTSGHKFVRVVELDSSSKAIGYGDAILNIGK